MGKKKSREMSVHDLLKLENATQNDIKLEIGDMLQFNAPERTGEHHHWAIYTRDKTIIHFLNDSCVHEDPIIDYVNRLDDGRKMVQINNWADNGYQITNGLIFREYTHIKPRIRSAENIVIEAEEYLEDRKNFGGYDAYSNNCEKFVTQCRYDVAEGFSGQTLGHGANFRPILTFFENVLEGSKSCSRLFSATSNSIRTSSRHG